MTKEEKELLLKDLSARLPYFVKCKIIDLLRVSNNQPDTTYTDILSFKKLELFSYHNNFEIKPYLRPMSSMTEEEWVELGKIANDGEWIVANFYYSHHIDCWGLIPKGLALEAPEGMYKID